MTTKRLKKSDKAKSMTILARMSTSVSETRHVESIIIVLILMEVSNAKRVSFASFRETQLKKAFTQTSGAITRDTLIGTGITIFKAYKISVDLKVPKNTSGKWANIFIFTGKVRQSKLNLKSIFFCGTYFQSTR